MNFTEKMDKVLSSIATDLALLTTSLIPSTEKITASIKESHEKHNKETSIIGADLKLLTEFTIPHIQKLIEGLIEPNSDWEEKEDEDYNEPLGGTHSQELLFAPNEPCEFSPQGVLLAPKASSSSTSSPSPVASSSSGRNKNKGVPSAVGRSQPCHDVM